MKTLSMLLLLAFPSLAVGQVESAVYTWRGLEVEPGLNREVRPILEGRTTDLTSLSVRAVTLPIDGSTGAAQSHPDLGMLLIVKEGQLEVVLPSARTVLNPRGVAVIMSGDAYRLANAGSAPVTYYEFAYRSKSPADIERARAAGGSFAVNWNDLEFRPSETGGQWHYFERPTAMFERFEMHTSRLNPGVASHPPHSHPDEEFFLVFQGDLAMDIAGEHPAATVGDLVFIGSDVPHTLANGGSGPAEYFAFAWR